MWCVGDLVWLQVMFHLGISWEWCASCGEAHAPHQCHSILDASLGPRVIANVGAYEYGVDELQGEA